MSYETTMVDMYRRMGGNKVVWCGRMSRKDSLAYIMEHPNAFSVKVGTVG